MALPSLFRDTLLPQVARGVWALHSGSLSPAEHLGSSPSASSRSLSSSSLSPEFRVLGVGAFQYQGYASSSRSSIGRPVPGR